MAALQHYSKLASLIGTYTDLEVSRYLIGSKSWKLGQGQQAPIFGRGETVSESDAGPPPAGACPIPTRDGQGCQASKHTGHNLSSGQLDEGPRAPGPKGSILPCASASPPAVPSPVECAPPVPYLAVPFFRCSPFPRQKNLDSQCSFSRPQPHLTLPHLISSSPQSLPKVP